MTPNLKAATAALCWFSACATPRAGSCHSRHSRRRTIHARSAIIERGGAGVRHDGGKVTLLLDPVARST